MDSVILALLFALGIAVGTQLNRGIYRLAWSPRWISPWSPAHEEAPARRAFDRIPLLGWIGLARESAIHGRGFWVRPMLIELGTGACFAGLYWHEVLQQGAVPPGAIALATPFTLHIQYFAHITLFSLMLVATFIDFDEQTIPDAITLPGTVIGLLFLLAFPTARLLVPTAPPLPAEHLTPVSNCLVSHLVDLAEHANMSPSRRCLFPWLVWRRCSLVVDDSPWTQESLSVPLR